ncbi:MAG TPA: phenylalanine--tRNA ligase subunit beta [Candidatus Udaeobacter sp.]|jgi:phenylalanyl-tRNA synthetase beta chain|nr:phenylalanine--tRNA ligase subunit beta [Candidatus Udaeobacter sp.]
MKLPLSWLREWIDTDAPAEKIAEALTTRGFYVEGIETRGASYPGVVVARVLEVKKHPNADKLSLCRVDSGQGELTIVCGAPNVRAGMIVPLATQGARLPGGLVIRHSRIRGEESQGMICSARELALSDEHEGILDLERWANEGGASDGSRPAGVSASNPAGAATAQVTAAALVIGRPFDELCDPPDQVLEVEVPFNRPDGLGVLGLAREVRAALGASWSATARTRLSARWQGRADFDLELEDREGCPRYLAQRIDGVVVAPSPPWLRRRLESAGQRSINGIVDLTNLVLLEFGQPVHAFDAAKLAGNKIRVRRAQAGETLTTLDGKTRTLDPEVLVIADRDRPVALAGVMGGQDSEVTETTTSLLLECAWFDPRRVRRSARAVGLATEASKRYERGVDPEIGSPAAARFLALLKEICPNLKPMAARERNHLDGRRRTLLLRPARSARILGLDLGAAESKRLLDSLEFGVEAGDPLRVTVPSWRPDITIEDDLIEEIARAHGYEKIPETRLETSGVYAVRSESERRVARARRAMLARGLDEAWTPTLVAEREAADAARLMGESAERLVRLVNPTSRESEVLRPSPVAGLLRACAHNLRQGAGSVRLFEVGTGFLKSAGELPEEQRILAALVAGARYAHAHDAAQGLLDFEDAKGLWEAWLEEMRVDTPEWRAYSADGWKPGASAEVASRTSRIGWAGTLHPALTRAWDIEVPVHLFVVFLDALARGAADVRASLPGRFPPVRRDLAFFVPASVTHLEIERALSEAAGDALASIEVFDVYAGSGTPEGMKSLAYALKFQHPERTLTEAEVQRIQDRMVAAVAKERGGRLREK